MAEVEEYDDGDLGMDEMDALEEIQELDEKEKPEEVTKESRALQILNNFHPECRLDYREDILQKLSLESYPPDNSGDVKHRSVPYLTLFERTKILGFRANQLAQGAKPFLVVPPHMTDVLEIAALELEQRRLPQILKRPMPDGSFEQWRLSDLMIV